MPRDARARAASQTALSGGSVRDDAAMERAVALGEQGRCTAPPNPWVGCVLVRDGQVVGEGFHHAPGEPHAEVNALETAGDRARGATAFVSLEPCAHHGRTPPCAQALLGAGVERVVIALLDPDVRTGGQGVRSLREGGVQVELGVGKEAAGRSLGPYLFQRTTGRAWCLLKAAVSIDGRTAAADGSSQWITGLPARRDAHRLRAESQAILIGSGTALADQPMLTVRDGDVAANGLPTHQPLRVLLDARGRVPATGPLFDTDLAPTLVLTTAAASSEIVKAWTEAGAEVVELPAAAAADESGVDLDAVLELLGERQILQVLAEGGSTVHGALLRSNLVNHLVIYVGAKLLGELGTPLVAGPGPSGIEAASALHLVSVRQIGDDVRIDYEPERGT